MKKIFFAALAAMGVVLGTAAMVTPAYAALPTYDNQASQAGGNG